MTQIRGSAQATATRRCRLSARSCPSGTSAGDTPLVEYGSHGNKFSGDVNWVQIDLEKDDHGHLISPEERFKVAMARQ
jgi:hypothetical protein